MWPAARTRVAAPRAWALIDCLQPFAPDSPVEGTGFEPSVPRQEKWSMPSSSDQTRVGRTLTLGGGAESSLEGRDIELSVSPKDIRTSPYDLCANRSDRRQSREGDRWFESTFLQRRVRLSPGAAVEGREPRLSARLCAAGLATGSAETRRVLQDRANRRQYLCRAIFQYRSAR